jgi:hypothetical protein
MDPEPPPAELALPPDNSGCAAGCAVLFVGSFVALAVYNLSSGAGVPLIGSVASVAWLALVALVLGVALRAAGLSGAVVALLAPFSKWHFADARPAGGPVLIGFGYALFGRRWYFLRVPPGRVASVSMGTGQATALAGRDMSDWSVALRYQGGDAPPPLFDGRPIYEVYLIGPPGPRERTAELFASVVAFLRAAGVELHPTDGGAEFRAAPPAPE